MFSDAGSTPAASTIKKRAHYFNDNRLIIL